MASKSEVAAQRADQDEIAEQLEQLEILIDRCRTMYEQFFMGMQKVPPSHLHRKAERMFLQLTQGRIANTGQRFKFNTLSQKFGSYSTYWKRTLRQIEQGKYLPHLKATARKRAREGKEMPDEMLQQLPKRLRERILRDRDRVRERAEREDARAAKKAEAGQVREQKKHAHKVDLDLDDDFDFDAMFDAIKAGDEAPAEPPKPQPKPKPKPRPAPRRPAVRGHSSEGDRLPPGMTEHETRDLYDKFVKAKKLVGGGDQPSYKSLLKTLNKQAPKILEQHKAKRVEFNVVIKEDRVVLKAKPKKD